MKFTENREITFYSIIVIALSSVICFISYKTGNSDLAILSVFTPTVLAFIFTSIKCGKKGRYELFVKQTFQKINFKWLLLSLFGIPFVGVIAMLTSLIFDFSGFGLRTTQLMPQIVVIILIALGEEYGWRGFLLPRLMKKFNLFYSSIILGFIWGIWHFPAYLIGTGVPLQMNFMVFLFWVILGALFMSWIYFYTKSVLTSILFHIGANAAFNYLIILPEFTGSMKTFYIFLFYLIIVVTALYFFSRNRKMHPVYLQN